jgi:hypothetical protein
MEQLVGGGSDDQVGKVLELEHGLVAGSIEDVIAMVLSIDAATPLRDVPCYVTPICPPAKAYIIKLSELGELEAHEQEMRAEKPHLFPRARKTWDGEL